MGSNLNFGDDAAMNRSSCPSVQSIEFHARRQRQNQIFLRNGSLPISRNHFTTYEQYRGNDAITSAKELRYRCRRRPIRRRDIRDPDRIERAHRCDGRVFSLSSSDINPKASKDVNRVQTLAELRNMALLPLKSVTSSGSSDKLREMYSSDAVIIFVNDIVLCPEDILELVFQYANQGGTYDLCI